MTVDEIQNEEFERIEDENMTLHNVSGSLAAQRDASKAHESSRPHSDIMPHGEAMPSYSDLSGATTFIIPTQRAVWPQYADHVSKNCGFDFDEKKGTRSHDAKGAAFWDRYRELHNRNRAHVEAGQIHKSRILVWRCREGDLCGGIGDEARGLSSMLYLAALLDRALFVQWSKHGENILSLFDMRSVNTTLPEQANLDDCTSVYAIDTSKNFEDYVKSDHKDISCMTWQTNTHPDILWTKEVGVGASSQFLESQQRLHETVSRTYAIGCAFNFLYSIHKGYLEMLKSTQFRRPLLRNGIDSSTSPVSPMMPAHGVQEMPAHGAVVRPTPLLPLKAKYIAIHMRFGDAAFSNANLPEGNDKERVVAAVNCAQQLGAKLFQDGEDWYVYMSSDYPGARKYALSMGVARMLEAPMDPVHIDHDQRKGRDVLWGSWADQFMLGRAWGLVWSASGATMSGFASTAAQTNFIPRENIIHGDPKYGCPIPKSSKRTPPKAGEDGKLVYGKDGELPVELDSPSLRTPIPGQPAPGPAHQPHVVLIVVLFSLALCPLVLFIRWHANKRQKHHQAAHALR